MRIAVMMEQSRPGGPDSMISDLINHWPERDSFIIYINESHKEEMKARGDFSGKNIEIKTIPGFSRGTVRRRYSSALPSSVLHVIAECLFLPMLVFSIIRQYSLLKSDGVDQTIVNNGGYPGGDLCIAAVIASKMAGLSPLLIIHNLPAEYRYKRIEKFLDYIVDRSADIVSVSKKSAHELSTHRNISQSITVIYNGISKQRISQSDKSVGCDGDNPIVLMIANLEERKGHYYLFNALSKMAFPIDIILIGDGTPDEVEEIQTLISEFDNGNVEFHQYVDTVGEYYAKADVFVLPSVRNESLPMTIIEAFSYELPVVASDVGGIRELIEDRANGMLVEPGNSDNLRDAINYVLKENANNDMSLKARKTYRDKFTIERMVKEYHNLIYKDRDQ